MHNLKNVNNTHGEVLILVKVKFLHGFLNCAKGTKSRKAPNIIYLQLIFINIDFDLTRPAELIATQR